MDARNAFSAKKVTTSVIKCANGFNHYGIRHAKINNNVIEANCPLCNSEETWEHVIKCRETMQLRREFMKELVVELVNNKPVNLCEDIIISFMEDIVTHLEDEEEEDECETNQCLIGMKELFRGCVMKMWEGTNVNCNKCKVLNKRVVRRCAEYYLKYWKNRNDAYHDEDRQNKRIKKWYKNEFRSTENSEYEQIREYAKRFKINEDRCSSESMKTWIMNLRVIKEKMENVLRNDMRRHVGSRETESRH